MNLAAIVLVALAANFYSQDITQPTGKAIFRDSDGNLISNNEFVDIRMANFHIKDRTLKRVLDDGTVEFRLQKIPQEGMAAPEFEVTDINGETIRMGELKGKVVVLNFWFVGCPACGAERPKLNEIRERFAGIADVEFIAITYDQPARVRRYLSENPFEYRIAAGAQGALNMFGFSGYPKNIVIGRDGEIKYWRSPIKAWEKFESVIAEELEKAAVEDQKCPICETEVTSSERYPDHVCSQCSARAADEAGRLLTFFNTSFSGGFAARYADNGEPRESHLCYIDGIPCRADEARFGGIVIRPYHAQK